MPRHHLRSHGMRCPRAQGMQLHVFFCVNVFSTVLCASSRSLSLVLCSIQSRKLLRVEQRRRIKVGSQSCKTFVVTAVIWQTILSDRYILAYIDVTGGLLGSWSSQTHQRSVTSQPHPDQQAACQSHGRPHFCFGWYPAAGYFRAAYGYRSIVVRHAAGQQSALTEGLQATRGPALCSGKPGRHSSESAAEATGRR